MGGLIFFLVGGGGGGLINRNFMVLFNKLFAEGEVNFAFQNGFDLSIKTAKNTKITA